MNCVVAEGALKAFNHHLWYLTSEMVPLALFSETVPEGERREEKKRIALEQESTTLADLVLTDSWFLNSLIEVHDAMQLQIGLIQHYIKPHLLIAYESNECNKRLCISSTKSETHYQNML